MRTIIEQRIVTLCRTVDANPSAFAALSNGEKLAVAFVLDRPDLLGFWGTMLEAIHRLGEEWHDAAFHVQRRGWREDGNLQNVAESA